jgi:hypothetical protein
MARHAAASARSRRLPALAAVAALAVAGIATGLLLSQPAGSHLGATGHHGHDGRSGSRGRSTSTLSSTSTTTSTTTTTTLPAPSPGFAAGHITAVGDSVMIDYQQPLQSDIPGVDVHASVSEQWGAGESELQQLKSVGALGAEVIVALSTNGPITGADFDTMMGILQGASRIVFVNVHVDRPWQDPNNQVLAQGAARYKNVLIADWASLASQHPEWFGPDGTHLAINGPGAMALASLITSTLTGG